MFIQNPNYERFPNVAGPEALRIAQREIRRSSNVVLAPHPHGTGSS